MSKSIYSSFTVDGETELNAELRRRGIPKTIGDLFHDATLSPECGAELLEVFRSPLPFNVRTPLAQALFARKLKPAQKREAFGILLELIKENPEKYNSLSMLVWNELPNHVDPSRVHELGQMALDPKYGPLRSGFLMALKKIRNAEAIGYLQRAARDPLTAAHALGELERLRVEGTLELCDQALALPGLLHAEVIRKTRAKLGRRMEAVPPLAHVVKHRRSLPKGLEEWSQNLDAEQLLPMLHILAGCLEHGFGPAEVAEVAGVVDEMKLEQTKVFRFSVVARGEKGELWLTIFMDDTDSPDLEVHASQAIIREFSAAMKQAEA